MMQKAIAFYVLAVEGKQRLVVETYYVGNDYILPNPKVLDGKKHFIEYFERMQLQYPNKSIDFVRCNCKDEFDTLHTHQKWSGNDAYVAMGFFRFDNYGNICEHWDAIHETPKSSANHHTIY